MSFWGVVIGTVGQGMLALFMFMLAAFAGGGLASGRSSSLGSFVMKILNSAIYLLPLSCIVSAAAVIYCYLGDGTAMAYWWYAFPIVLAVAYLVFVRNQ